VNPSTSSASPLSPTPSTADGFLWSRSLLFGLLLAGGFLVGLLLAFAMMLAARMPFTSPLHPVLNWGVIGGQVLSYVPVLVVLLPGLPWLSRRSLGDLGLRAPSAAEVRWGVGGGALMLAVALAVAALQSVVLHLKSEQLPVQLLSSAHDPLLIAGFALLACVLAPLVEESVFRGFVFNALGRYLPFWPAAVLSGAAFALAHWDASAFAPLCAGGVVLAWVYRRSGALIGSMIAHGTFNTVQVLLIVFAHQT
jgi:membrane protease YdiL (CAAX protease family)